MSSISALSMTIPVRSPTLIGLGLTMKTLIDIVEKRKKLITCT
jgi:hypothetical protein